MFFKKKCKHTYHEIGRYYIETAYANDTVINGIIVYECEQCHTILEKTAYCQSFNDYNQIQLAKDAVNSLEKAGFQSFVDYQMSRITKKGT